MRVKLKEAPQGIIHLYDMVARLMGNEDTSNLRYNCTKINVSQDISDVIELAYRTDAYITDWKLAFGTDWCCYGPKVDESLPGATVEVQDGFIVEGTPDD